MIDDNFRSGITSIRKGFLLQKLLSNSSKGMVLSAFGWSLIHQFNRTLLIPLMIRILCAGVSRSLALLVSIFALYDPMVITMNHKFKMLPSFWCYNFSNHLHNCFNSILALTVISIFPVFLYAKQRIQVLYFVQPADLIRVKRRIYRYSWCALLSMTI